MVMIDLFFSVVTFVVCCNHLYKQYRVCICKLLAHLSRSDKVSFCDQSSSVVVRPLTIDLNDIS